MVKKNAMASNIMSWADGMSVQTVLVGSPILVTDMRPSTKNGPKLQTSFCSLSNGNMATWQHQERDPSEE